MAYKRFAATFVTERTFKGWYYSYDQEKDTWLRRMFESRITCDPKHLFCDRVNLAGGLPLLWQHGSSWSRMPAVGKVTKMQFMGRKLVGELEVDEGNLANFAPGGLEALTRGVNSGLSAGMQFLTAKGGDMTKRDGTVDKPDRFRYDMMSIVEMSLTPTPRIADCGITGELK